MTQYDSEVLSRLIVWCLCVPMHDFVGSLAALAACGVEDQGDDGGGG